MTLDAENYTVRRTKANRKRWEIVGNYREADGRVSEIVISGRNTYASVTLADTAARFIAGRGKTVTIDGRN